MLVGSGAGLAVRRYGRRRGGPDLPVAFAVERPSGERVADHGHQLRVWHWADGTQPPGDARRTPAAVDGGAGDPPQPVHPRDAVGAGRRGGPAGRAGRYRSGDRRRCGNGRLPRALESRVPVPLIEGIALMAELLVRLGTLKARSGSLQAPTKCEILNLGRALSERSSR
jgi:hypothetical protein